jgi:hypothetical protein
MTVGDEWFDAMLNPACTIDPVASTADITVHAQPDNKHGLSAAQTSEATRRDLLTWPASRPIGLTMSVVLMTPPLLLFLLTRTTDFRG